jgi:crotonobetainyl-CoA:carnitine CoA-transferase CaiB-like acyl-CoA transferase
MSSDELPLGNVLAVSVEQAVAAPTCTARLADAGARVIKVERPEGDFARGYDDYVKGEATYFVWANRGKESICLDLKSSADREVLERILAQADVFVQNLAVGAADRLGFGAEALRQRYPRLITCSISGYGETGSHKNMKAYDLLIQAESGLSSISGGNRIGVSIADIITGINAYGAILEALAQRARTGKGSHVSLSLFDSVADLMAVPILQQTYTGVAPRNVGMHHPSIAPYGSFPCRDGTEVIVAVQNNREWSRLCEQVLELPGLTHDSRFADNKSRTANRTELEQIISEATRRHPLDDLIEKLKGAGIAHGMLNDLPAVIAHPALRNIPVRLPDGQVADIPAPPARTPWRPAMLGPVPALGQHDKDIRAEFSGLSKQ